VCYVLLLRQGVDVCCSLCVALHSACGHCSATVQLTPHSAHTAAAYLQHCCPLLWHGACFTTFTLYLLCVCNVVLVLTLCVYLSVVCAQEHTPPADDYWGSDAPTRTFWKMLPDVDPQWIAAYPTPDAPRTGRARYFCTRVTRLRCPLARFMMAVCCCACCSETVLLVAYSAAIVKTCCCCAQPLWRRKCCYRL
jgi:hypothetical protein